MPDIVGVNDAKVFEANKNHLNEAQSCGAYLNRLRSNAKFQYWARTGTTIAGGATAAVSGYFAATKEKEDSTKTEAIVALIGGIVAVLAQAIPDPTGALSSHQKAKTGWDEARRRAIAGSPPLNASTFNLLLMCRRGQEFAPESKGGEAIPD